MKQLTLFPELDLSSNEPIIHDGASGKFINKFVEKKSVPVRKPNAVPPKTKTIQKFNNGGATQTPKEILEKRICQNELKGCNTFTTAIFLNQNT